MKLCKHEDCAKQSTHIYEKKDACYTKVKSRYDVWPSAYASGALVKCRKVGAKNWGNSKKESVDEAVYQFKRYTNTQMDELDAELHRGGFRGPPDLNKMTYTTDEISSKLDKIIKSKGGKKIKESVDEMKKLFQITAVKKAIAIAKKMKGNMTGAVKKIEKMNRGLSDEPDVAAALKKANESVNEINGVDLAKKVLKDKQHEKGIDLQTANLIVTIDKAYDKNPSLQKKFRAIPLAKMKKLISQYSK